MNVYVASSWRNQAQPSVVDALRTAGHEVYDFRHPAPGNDGFSWREISPNWETWTPAQLIEALKHPVSCAGFKLDMDALKACDACVLVLPCGRSAHLELGWATGAGKKTVVLLAGAEPELMYKMCDHLCLDIGEVLAALGVVAPPKKEACQSEKCAEVAVARVLWPGRPPVNMCLKCGARAQAVGDAMGCYIGIEELR